MYMQTVWLLKLLVIWLCIAQAQQYSDVPNSPCPRIFQYKYNGDYYGELQLPSPPIQPGEIVLTVVLTLRAATSVSIYGRLATDTNDGIPTFELSPIYHLFTSPAT